MSNASGSLASTESTSQGRSCQQAERARLRSLEPSARSDSGQSRGGFREQTHGRWLLRGVGGQG